MVGNPLEYAFWAGAPAEAPTSYQALLARRKIAESLLGKRSPFPTTLGEGLTYAGERIADTMRMKDLDERERAQAVRDQRAMAGPLGIPTGAAPVPGAPAPVAAAAAEPSLFQPAPVPSAAALGPNAGAPLTEFPALGDNFKPQTPLAGPMVPNAGRFMPNITNANTGNSVIGGQLSPRSFGNRAYGALPDVPSAAVTPNTEPDLRGGIAQSLVEQNQPLTRTAALPPTTATDAVPASPQIPPEALSPNPMGAPIRPPQLRPSPLPSPLPPPRISQPEPTPDDNPPIVTAQIKPAPPATAPNMAGSAVPPPLKPYDPGPEPARPTPTREMQYWKGIADNQSLSDDVRIRAQKKYEEDSKHLSEDYVRRWTLWKEEERKSRDPATGLDLRSKQLTAEKLARDLEGEGFLPLTPDEAKTFPNLPPGVTAYKNRRGEVKFSPTPPASTNVTVDQRTENEEAKVSGKLAAEHMGETMKAASTAGNSLYTINRAKSLLDKIDTGALAPASLSVGAFARSLGVPDPALASIGLKPDMIGKRQAFDAIVGELVIGKIGAGGFPSNNFSNTDRTFLQNTVASLGSDPESNRIKLDAMHLIAQRDIEKANEWDAFRNKPGNKGKGFFDFQHQWDRKIQQQDLTGELQKRADNLLANAASNIPQEAIKILRNNPSSADKFDRRFGEGASKRYLGQ